MLEMDPRSFEEFTGRALESLGYTNVIRVGGSGDLAADLTATDPQGRSAIVQCKRYTPGSKVGSPALQSFIGMKEVHHRADRGIFVTTADYSQEALDLAKAHNIVLIDGDDLVKIVKS
jgi:restriction system protein